MIWYSIGILFLWSLFLTKGVKGWVQIPHVIRTEFRSTPIAPYHLRFRSEQSLDQAWIRLSSSSPSYSSSNEDAYSSNESSQNHGQPPPPQQQQSDGTSSSIKSDDFLDRDEHVRLLDASLRKFHPNQLGLLEVIYGPDNAPTRHLWDDVHMSMRFALMSHGKVNGLDGPILNYANFGACAAFQTSRSQLLDMPSCRMASVGRDQLALSDMYQQLRETNAEVPERNILLRYQGFRCTMLDATPFLIQDGLVRRGLML